MNTTQKPFDINAPIEHIQTLSGRKIVGIVNHGLGNKPLAVLFADDNLATNYTATGHYYSDKSPSADNLVVRKPDKIRVRYFNMYADGSLSGAYKIFDEAKAIGNLNRIFGVLEITTNLTKNTVTTIFHPA